MNKAPFLIATLFTTIFNAACTTPPKISEPPTPLDEFISIPKGQGTFVFNNNGDVLCEVRSNTDWPNSNPTKQMCDEGKESPRVLQPPTAIIDFEPDSINKNEGTFFFNEKGEVVCEIRGITDRPTPTIPMKERCPTEHNTRRLIIW